MVVNSATDLIFIGQLIYKFQNWQVVSGKCASEFRRSPPRLYKAAPRFVWRKVC
jgi:hypothetical protein